jgi:hypothetical protein
MQYGYWKVRVIQKHKLPASWRHIVPGAFVLALLLLLLLSAVSFLLWIAFPGSVAGNPSSMVRSACYFSFQASALLLLAICAAYCLAVLMASVLTAAKTGWKLLPVLPVVFPCYHLGYGFGFLRGILDFVILRRGTSISFAELTRNS